MMVVYNLADGDVTKFEAVFQQPWSYVFMARMINLQMNKYQRAIRSIK